ncbi:MULTISPECIES: nucleotidyltransferase domain-containing protein [unclassified Nitratiruptor]|uniref:nucleotidyltransferase domain-containing protein n=1 Tax=unclassified Nitratiruptor TaxID=2624044 RepID=UPI001915CDAE|nr:MULTISPECIES: nucleotidyltransferase domain-containing protein [unclassified Nitratiruptor]BCD60217.1 hypothetical protein NitYY0810_C0982 [Nitratiruptor sp. YY08-10]BCD64294.1 hypothetical protein NitYY0814_C1139 [Nitratiruptor sp. YY08-14]
MRLSKDEIEIIKRSFEKVFSQGKIILFGSRVYDYRKGGDIDLYLIVPKHERKVSKKLDFLVELRKKIVYKKIDIVFHRDTHRTIEQEAKKGIVIYQKKG